MVNMMAKKLDLTYKELALLSIALHNLKGICQNTYAHQRQYKNGRSPAVIELEQLIEKITSAGNSEKVFPNVETLQTRIAVGLEDH